MKSFYMHDKSLAEIEAEVGAPLLAEIAELHQIIDDLQQIIDKQDEELALAEEGWQDFVSAAQAWHLNIEDFDNYTEVLSAVADLGREIGDRMAVANRKRNYLISMALQEHSDTMDCIVAGS